MQVDEGVVRLQDIIIQLQKCDSLPAETEKAVERARALITDSASSRQVCGFAHGTKVCWNRPT